jgi:hypothetical protein
VVCSCGRLMVDTTYGKRCQSCGRVELDKERKAKSDAEASEAVREGRRNE